MEAKFYLERLQDLEDLASSSLKTSKVELPASADLPTFTLGGGGTSTLSCVIEELLMCINGINTWCRPQLVHFEQYFFSRQLQMAI